MSFLWTFLKIVALAFVPVPVYPRLNRPDPAKNLWTFECSGFTSVFQEAKVFWKTPAIESLLGKSRTILNAPSESSPPPNTPPRAPTRRSSIRPGEGGNRSD